jgi:hypothetical protein
LDKVVMEKIVPNSAATLSFCQEVHSGRATWEYGRCSADSFEGPRYGCWEWPSLYYLQSSASHGHDCAPQLWLQWCSKLNLMRLWLTWQLKMVRCWIEGNKCVTSKCHHHDLFGHGLRTMQYWRGIIPFWNCSTSILHCQSYLQNSHLCHWHCRFAACSIQWGYCHHICHLGYSRCGEGWVYWSTPVHSGPNGHVIVKSTFPWFCVARNHWAVCGFQDVWVVRWRVHYLIVMHLYRGIIEANCLHPEGHD